MDTKKLKESLANKLSVSKNFVKSTALSAASTTSKAGKSVYKYFTHIEPEYDYTFSVDKNMRRTFRALVPMQLLVEQMVYAFQTIHSASLLGGATKIGPDQFPSLYKMVVECADTLGIEVPNVYIVNSPVKEVCNYSKDKHKHKKSFRRHFLPNTDSYCSQFSEPFLPALMEA